MTAGERSMLVVGLRLASEAAALEATIPSPLALNMLCRPSAPTDYSTLLDLLLAIRPMDFVGRVDVE